VQFVALQVKGDVEAETMLGWDSHLDVHPLVGRLEIQIGGQIGERRPEPDVPGELRTS
jgi:hypothetical protein